MQDKHVTLKRHVICTPVSAIVNPILLGSKSGKYCDWSAYPFHFSTDEAVVIGDLILTQMNGTTHTEYTFQKYIVTLACIDKYTVLIDQLLLFQILTTVMQSLDDLEIALILTLFPQKNSLGRFSCIEEKICRIYFCCN